MMLKTGDMPPANIPSTQAERRDSGAEPVEASIMRVVEQYRAALQAGDKPDRQAFLARYPEMADALAECLDALEFIENAAPQLQQSAPEQANKASVSAAEIQPEGPLGDFRLVREIGRGGMGVVYEAVQISLGRRVALKVLPFAAAMDAKQLQRFKNEAQAAAHLHHTNIVPVHAVGCERGVHFYAMQYIEGQTLAQVIQELRRSGGNDECKMTKQPSGPDTLNRDETPIGIRHSTLDIPSSLGIRHSSFYRTVAHLGVQAAEALEHAHQLGVVHRDIKPANLLVDVRGNLWITDFGLAHCQSQAGLTMTGDLVGTLRYMSPEQAQGKRQLLDHRTDIYSLGVTLYELLTLEPAFSGSDRGELLQRIAFEDPPLPRQRNKAIPRELETIVLKAIEKSPEARYPTAQELADDLRRHLEDKPIRAKRPKQWQRAAKWTRRHKTVVWAAVLLLVVAMIGSAVSTFLIMQQRDVAQQQRDAAEANYRRAEQILDTAYRSLEKVYLAWAEKRLPHSRELSPDDRQFLEGALTFYMEFANQNSSERKGRQKTAEAYLRVATIQAQLGQDSEAKGIYHHTLEAFRGLADEYPNDPIYRCHLARCLSEMADDVMHPPYFDPMRENEEAFRQAIKLQERLITEDCTCVDYRHDLALSYSRLGSHLHGCYSRYNEAEPLFRSACTILSSLAEEHPTVVTYRQDYCDVLGKLAWLWMHTGRLQQAGQLFGESLELRKKLVHDFPGQLYPRFCLGWGYENLAEWQLVTRRLEDGAETCRQGVDIRAKLAADFAGVQVYRQHLAISYRMLGDSIKELGQLESALTWYDQAISTLTNVPVDETRLVVAREPQLHMARGARAVALLQLGRFNEAEQAFEELEQNYDKAVQLDPTFYWNWVCDAELHLHLGDLEGYRGVCREMLARFGHTDNPPWANATAKACLLAPAAVSDLGPILQLAERDFPEQNLFYCYNVLVKGMVEYRAGHFDHAIDRLNQTLSLGREPRYCNPRSLSGTAYAFLAMAHHRLGRVAEARQALDQATQLVEQPYSKIDWNWSCERIWHDWLIFYLARQEAEKLLKGDASP
jgi:serine/threonine protein kinase